jgi:aldehyde:ferredoxin oxidoreductase
MTQKKAEREDINSLYGLGGKLLARKLNSISADKDNIILSAGLLAGTKPLFAGRLTLALNSSNNANSKESNTGGFFAEYMGRLNISALVFEGEASGCNVIYVSSQGIEICEIPELKGLDYQHTTDAVFDYYGRNSAVGCIDGLGEKSNIESAFGITDKNGKVSHFAGRRGIGAGAAFAAKGIKAIVVEAVNEQHLVFANKGVFQKSADNLIDLLNKSGESILSTEGECLDCGYTSCNRRRMFDPCETKRNKRIEYSAEAAFIDSMGVCLFAVTELQNNTEGLQLLADMCNARYGLNKSLDDYLGTAGE